MPPRRSSTRVTVFMISNRELRHHSESYGASQNSPAALRFLRQAPELSGGPQILPMALRICRRTSDSSAGAPESSEAPRIFRRSSELSGGPQNFPARLRIFPWLSESSDGPPENPGGLVWLSVLAIGLLVISGWLGGKMVYVLGVAVDTPPEAKPR